MRTTPFLLLGALCVVPARAVICHSDSVRIDATGGKIRVSVKDGKSWRPVLESAASRGGARINTLEYSSARVAVSEMGLSRPFPEAGGVYTVLKPEGNRLHVETTVNLNPNNPADIEAIDAGWHFLGGKPDFTWTPNLRQSDDEVIGRHVFRSPAVVVQRGGLAAVLLPELGDDMARMPLPATLNLDVRDPKGPRLDYDFQQHDVVRHVFWRHESGKTVRVDTSTAYHFAYDILLPVNAEPHRAYRLVTRWWARRITDSPEAQSVPWKQYAKTGIDKYMLPIGWRQTTMDGEVVGGVAMNVLAAHESTWFQCWFNDLRSAYGTYLWGQRLKRPDLVRKARQTRQLLLHAPSTEGLFPVIYDWTDRKWLDSSAGGVGGGSDIFHTVDCAWAAYWLLMWNRDLERSPESVEMAKRLGDFMIAHQLPSGEIPAYWETGARGQDSGFSAGSESRNLTPGSRLMGGAESAGCGMFLAFLGRETHEAKYVVAARKVAGYVRRDIMPRNKWFDYETFFSCSWKPETFYDPITDQNPQNNLSIHWAAEMFRQLYLADHKAADLAEGEALMDYLNLYQQCWSPPWMTFEGYGGYGVQNTDAEWNDARQAQFACTNLDYYQLTGKPEYMIRGIAALRAGFATMYMPENKFISPYTYDKKPTGYADENYGHGGNNGPAGPTSWDWGTGSALASVAYAKRAYGDVWVDWDKREAFGIDGVSAKLSEPVTAVTPPGGTHPRLTIVSGVRTLSDVTVRGKGKARADVIINGKRRALKPSDWKSGFAVTPARGAVVHHQTPAALTADQAYINYEVWPLYAGGLSAAVTVVASIWQGGQRVSGPSPVREVGIVAVGYQFAHWSPSAFRPGTQMLEYQFNDKNGRVLGPFRVPVVRFGKESFLWSDAFVGPDLGPDWKVETQAGGATISASNGLTVALPGDKPYDLWAGVLNGHRVLRQAPDGDWSYTVTMRASEKFGNWQAGLCVALNPGEFAMFGPFQGNSITLEASGRNGLASFPSPAGKKPIELRARRTVDTLWFDWRVAGGTWSVPAPLSISAPPGEVGVFAKTWQPMAVSARFTEAVMATMQ